MSLKHCCSVFVTRKVGRRRRKARLARESAGSHSHLRLPFCWQDCSLLLSFGRHRPSRVCGLSSLWRP